MILIFLVFFIFGFFYVLVLVWDVLWMKNMIQIIGLCVVNLVFFVYIIFQIDQIEKLLDILQGVLFLKDSDKGGDLNIVWVLFKFFLIVVLVIVGVVIVVMFCIVYQLYCEFVWDILKQIGVDYCMKKWFFYYQVGL